MRRRVVAICGLFLACHAGAYGAETGAKMLDDLTVKAFLAGDLEGLVALYAPDATVYPPGPPTEARGSAAIRKVMGDFMQQFTVREFRIVDATYETAGDLSVGWGRWVLVGVPKGGGEPVRLEARFTSVAKRFGSKWLFISDHASLNPPAAQQ